MNAIYFQYKPERGKLEHAISRKLSENGQTTEDVISIVNASPETVAVGGWQIFKNWIILTHGGSVAFDAEKLEQDAKTQDLFPATTESTTRDGD